MSRLRHRHKEQLSRTAGRCDRGHALHELHMEKVELEALTAELKERSLMLEDFQQRKEELQKKIEKSQELHKNYYMFLKDDENNKAAEKVSKEVRQRDAEIEKLKKMYADLTKKKQELLHEMQRFTVYKDFMDRVCKVTKFKDPDALADYIESRLHIRNQLCQREDEAQGQVNQKRKEQVDMEDQHNLLMLQKNTNMSHLQTELKKARSETLKWEKRWSHIQETAAEKTLTLGRIKMVTLNLYEMTGAEIGEEGVDINDTEKQLEQIKMFYEDHMDIVKQYGLQKQSDRKKRSKAKKCIT